MLCSQNGRDLVDYHTVLSSVTSNLCSFWILTFINLVSKSHGIIANCVHQLHIIRWREKGREAIFPTTIIEVSRLSITKLHTDQENSNNAKQNKWQKIYIHWGLHCQIKKMRDEKTILKVTRSIFALQITKIRNSGWNIDSVVGRNYQPNLCVSFLF